MLDPDPLFQISSVDQRECGVIQRDQSTEDIAPTCGELHDLHKHTIFITARFAASQR